ncbi:MAG: aldo/keto reductase [Gemmataceae bacterium]
MPFDNRLNVCRAGLATRGNGNLLANDVHHAIECGIDFLNWCGHADGLSRAVSELGKKRDEIKICVQFEARTARAARAEFASICTELNTDHIDALTFYYVEAESEWQEICAQGGALEYCVEAKRNGRLRWIGLTSHQRQLAARWAQSGQLDLLMLRYNAAHRGCEQDVFPITDALGLPVVVYTCLRWGALLQPTRDDPPGFVVPRAPDWYRFALHSQSVAVAVMAPANRAELEEDLSVLAASPLNDAEFARLAEHGQRVRRYAGSFP